MTEAEWLACRSPEPMLEHLRHLGLLSDRKLRLFAAACCRRIWRFLKGTDGRALVECAERFADGLASREELGSATEAAKARDTSTVGPPAAANAVAIWLGSPNTLPFGPLDYVASQARTVAVWSVSMDLKEQKPTTRKSAKRAARSEQEAAQARLLLDLFGNPFRPAALTLEALSLRRESDTVLHLAQAIYAEGTFDHLPILGDALEEAGCTEAVLLDHCRASDPHVRGCWLLDLLSRERQ